MDVCSVWFFFVHSDIKVGKQQHVTQCAQIKHCFNLHDFIPGFAWRNWFSVQLMLFILPQRENYMTTALLYIALYASMLFIYSFTYCSLFEFEIQIQIILICPLQSVIYHLYCTVCLNVCECESSWLQTHFPCLGQLRYLDFDLPHLV